MTDNDSPEQNDDQFNLRLPSSLLKTFKSLYPDRQASMVLREVIRSLCAAPEATNEKPEALPRFVEPMKNTGLIDIIPDFRTYDFTEYLTDSREIYLCPSRFTRFMNQHAHREALLARLVSVGVKRTWLFIQISLTAEGEEPLYKPVIHSYEKSEHERLNNHLSVFTPQVGTVNREIHAIGNVRALPEFALVTDDVAICSYSGYSLNETDASSFAFIWKRPVRLPGQAEPESEYGRLKRLFPDVLSTIATSNLDPVYVDKP